MKFQTDKQNSEFVEFAIWSFGFVSNFEFRASSVRPFDCRSGHALREMFRIFELRLCGAMISAVTAGSMFSVQMVGATFATPTGSYSRVLDRGWSSSCRPATQPIRLECLSFTIRLLNISPASAYPPFRNSFGSPQFCGQVAGARSPSSQAIGGFQGIRLSTLYCPTLVLLCRISAGVVPECIHCLFLWLIL